MSSTFFFAGGSSRIDTNRLLLCSSLQPESDVIESATANWNEKKKWPTATTLSTFALVSMVLEILYFREFLSNVLKPWVITWALKYKGRHTTVIQNHCWLVSVPRKGCFWLPVSSIHKFEPRILVRKIHCIVIRSPSYLNLTDWIQLCCIGAPL